MSLDSSAGSRDPSGFRFSGVTADSWGFSPSSAILSHAIVTPRGRADLSATKICNTACKISGQPITVDTKEKSAHVMGFTVFPKAKPDAYTIGQVTQSPILRTPYVRLFRYNTKIFFFAQHYEYVGPPFLLTDSHCKTYKQFIEGARKNQDNRTHALRLL